MSVDHMHCPRCGEPMAWHVRPCGATKCVANDCDKPVVNRTLGICAEHDAILRSQQRSRYTDPYPATQSYVCPQCGRTRRTSYNPPPAVCRTCERSMKK